MSVFDAMAKGPFKPSKICKDTELIAYVGYEYNKDPTNTSHASRFNTHFLSVLRALHASKLPMTTTWAKPGVGQAATILSTDEDEFFRKVQDVTDGSSPVNKLVQWKQFLLYFVSLAVMTHDDLHIKNLKILHEEAKAKNDELNAGLLKREQEEDRANDLPVREKRSERIDRHAEEKLKSHIDAFSAVNMNVIATHLVTTIEAATMPGVLLTRLQLEADLDKLPRPPGFKNWRETELQERKRKQQELAEDWLD